MPITLTLRYAGGHSAEFHCDDVDLRAVQAAVGGPPTVVALQRYFLQRLAGEHGVAPAGREDQETLCRLITHWKEGTAGTRGEINVVTVPRTEVDAPGAGGGTSHDQTLRDALVARRRPLLLEYDDHLAARQRLRDLIAELGEELFLWTRADGWDPLLPDTDDDGYQMDRRAPVRAVGEAIQAIENGTAPERAVIAFQDLAWNVTGNEQVLATAIPSLWERLREQEGLLILLMPTSELTSSWSAMFEVIRFRAGESPTPLLDRFGKDLTAMARNGEIQPIAGREAERQAVLRALLQAPGATGGTLLIGSLGSGKTAIMEQVALDLLEPDIDQRLRGRRLIAIDMAALVAGTALRGDLEARVSQLIEEAEQHGNRIVLVIDEIHTIATTGASESGMPALEALKAPLARGRIRLIGATTPEDWAPVEQAQAAFASRFKKIHVSPATFEETIQAMALHRSHLEQYHGTVTVTDNDLRFVAQAVIDYLASPPMPREAIKLLYDLVARADSAGSSTVSAEMVFQGISEITGARVGPPDDEERETLTHLQDQLRQDIKGQDRAIETVSNAVVAHRLSRTRHRPTLLLMVGPTGTGKTEMVRTINRVLVPGQELIEYRMEEYYDRHTGASLLGAPPGYVGSEGGSSLVNQARRTPYRVVLLDELEKAHPEVIKQLMNLLLTGRYRDPRGIEGDFRRWVFCATSNVVTEKTVLQSPRSQLIEHVIRAFANIGVPREVVGRIGVIVPFLPLDQDALHEIALMKLHAFKREVLEESGSVVKWDDDVPRSLAGLAARSGLGARNIDQHLDPLRYAWAASALDPRLGSRPLIIEVDDGGEDLRITRGGS